MRAAPAAIAALLLASVAACASEPDSVLQTDLPQVPGLTPRDSSGIRQQGDRVVAGQFAYKGPVVDLRQLADQTMSRFQLAGWELASTTINTNTAVLVYRKDTRTARVEIIRNGVQPKMSTAVLQVQSTEAKDAPATTPAAETKEVAPAPAAPVAPAPADSKPAAPAPAAPAPPVSG